MGRLIPAGTGVARYRNIRLVAEAAVEAEADVPADAIVDEEMPPLPEEEAQEVSDADAE
jgi:hypothetical protein